MLASAAQGRLGESDRPGVLSDHAAVDFLTADRDDPLRGLAAMGLDYGARIGIGPGPEHRIADPPLIADPALIGVRVDSLHGRKPFPRANNQKAIVERLGDREHGRNGRQGH